jgi:hypothetical protein
LFESLHDHDDHPGNQRHTRPNPIALASSIAARARITQPLVGWNRKRKIPRWHQIVRARDLLEKQRHSKPDRFVEIRWHAMTTTKHGAKPGQVTSIQRKPTATAPAASTAPIQATFDKLPDSAWLRESQLVRSPKNPDSEVAPLPFSAPTLWRMVKLGTFPKPTKLSTRVTAWQAGQVRAWMAAQTAA